MSLQHYRSSTANKRPVAANMADGQIAVNTASSSPGLFVKDSGGAVVKIGPVHVGGTAPNASPAVGGSTGNSVGEIWLDTTGGAYTLKVWDGTAWRSEDGVFVNATGDTMTGNLTLNASNLIFNTGTFNTTISATTATAARSISLPDAAGAVVVTGATGQVTSSMIADGTIVNTDISATAAVAVSKLAYGTARQLLQTDSVGTGVEWTSNLQVPGTFGVTGATTFTGTVTSNNNVTLNAQSDLRFADADSSNWVALQAPATIAANITWSLPSADGSPNQVLKTDGSGNLSWASQSAGGDVFLASNNAFTGANTFFNATGQVFGASSTQDSLLLRGRVGGTTSLRINLEPAALSQTRTITFPNVDGSVITTGDTGTVTSAMIADGTISNSDISATAEIAVSKLANGTVARQILQTDALGTEVEWTSNLQIPGTLGVTGATTFTGAVTSNNNVTLNAQSDLRFADADSSNWVALQAPATIATNVTWSLPSADGSSNQVLKTDGLGNLGWATISSGGDVFQVNNNAFTGANTFYNSSGQTFGSSISTQDGIVLAGRAGGTTSLRVTFVPSALTGNRTLTLPDASGTIITTGDTGSVTSAMLADQTIVNADISTTAEIAVSKLANGTARQLLQTSATGIDVEWASNISIPGTLDVTGLSTLTGGITSGSNVTLNAQSDLRFADADSSNWVAFQAPTTIAANVTWTLPAADGSSSQVLKTDGFGNLGWVTISPGGTGDVIAANNNSFTGANTFYNGTGQTFGTASSTQDGIILQGRAGGTLSYRATIIPTALTGNRTLTLPNENGTFLTTASTGAIGNTLLANSSITVNGNSVSLGGSTTVTANTTNALTLNNLGAGAVSGTTFNGSSAVTLSYNTIGAAPLASPGLTGTPTAPTATTGTNTTQIATTAFVNSQIAASAPRLSANNTFTGSNTFSNASGLSILGSSSLEDGIQINPNGVGSSGWRMVFQTQQLTGNRNLQFPNVSGNVVTTGDTGTVSSTMLASNIINSILPSQTGNSGKALITNGTSASWDSAIVSKTAVSLTGFTVGSFTGIPSWAKRITLFFSAISTSTVNGNIVVQFGAGTYETTGYNGVFAKFVDNATVNCGADSALTGVTVVQGGISLASSVYYGYVRLNLLSGNTWIYERMVSPASSGGSNQFYMGTGSKTTSGAVDRIQILALSDTFDGGTVNVVYE